MRTKEQKIAYHLKKLTLVKERNKITDIQFNQIVSGILPKDIAKDVYTSIRKHYKLLTDYSK